MRGAAAFVLPIVIAAASCTPAGPPTDPVETAEPSAELARVAVTAEVPADAPTVYLTGNLPELGPWDADALAMSGDGATRTAALTMPVGHDFEFKLTLGAWENEGVGPSGTVLPNFTLTAVDGGETTVTVTDFKKDAAVYLADPSGAGVSGDLTVWLDVASEHLDETRHVVIWTPPGYGEDPEERHRVIYMHDGQNLFDPRIANTGMDWGADEAALRVAAELNVTPPIIVGVWSTNARRLEYAPAGVVDALAAEDRTDLVAEFGGAPTSDGYVRFLADELKPRVDAAFATATGPDDTLIAGSSMGGLISLYALAERPDVFGAAACLSMHWPIAITRERILDQAEIWTPTVVEAFTRYLTDEAGLEPERQRLWIDRGDVNLDALYPPYQDALTPVFSGLGFADEDLEIRAYPGADHNEAAWRARLDEPFRFLLSDGL